jgi:hypothetical protein
VFTDQQIILCAFSYAAASIWLLNR